MNNKRCLHSAHLPPRHRPQGRRRGQRYVKYIGPRSRCASQRRPSTWHCRRLAEGANQPAAWHALQYLHFKSETIGHFSSAVAQPCLSLRCFHLRLYRSFPHLAPRCDLVPLCFSISQTPPLVLAQRFSSASSSFGPLSCSSAGSFHLPSPLCISLSFLFVTHPPRLCLSLLLPVYPPTPHPIFSQKAGRETPRWPPGICQDFLFLILHSRIKGLPNCFLVLTGLFMIDRIWWA